MEKCCILRFHKGSADLGLGTLQYYVLGDSEMSQAESARDLGGSCGQFTNKVPYACEVCCGQGF